MTSPDELDPEIEIILDLLGEVPDEEINRNPNSDASIGLQKALEAEAERIVEEEF